MAATVTFKGNPLTLVGRRQKVGAPAPAFTCTSQELQPFGLASLAGSIKVLTSFPSIDTPVCDLQVKAFNKHAVGMAPDVTVTGISKDLPFAQKRFCAEFDITKIKVVSDYATSSFGINYGLLIKELNLLARAVLIVDKNDVIRYIQVVPELTQAPDYAHALKALDEVVKNPAPVAAAEATHCTPCAKGTPPMPREKVERLLAVHRGWTLLEDKKIVKEFAFKDFAEAKYFADTVSVIAEEQGHHPVITLMWGKLKISLTTHAAGGLTDNDFIMARAIDEAHG